MKKKHVFVAIAFFIVGLVYGSIFSFILQGENASILSSYMKGFAVGILALIIYLMVFVFFRYCYDEEYLNDGFSKFLIIFANIVVSVSIMYGITTFISSYNQYPITHTYAWMHIVNLLFAVTVVAKANYDGKVLRKKRKK